MLWWIKNTVLTSFLKYYSIVSYSTWYQIPFFTQGLDFIRAEGYVFSHVADEGLLNACAGDLLRYRKKIGADNVQIFTDIKKKHRYIFNLFEHHL